MGLRKAVLVSAPVMEISEKRGGKAFGIWTIKTSTTLTSMEMKFKLGEEFDETTPDGRQVSSLVTFEDGKIVTVQKAKEVGQLSTKYTREMKGADTLIFTLTIDGMDNLKCVQTFNRSKKILRVQISQLRSNNRNLLYIWCFQIKD